MVAFVVVDGGLIAEELRRRRLGRGGLADRVERAEGSTWLPGEGGSLRHTGNDLLVLAAFSLLGPGSSAPYRSAVRPIIPAP